MYKFLTITLSVSPDGRIIPRYFVWDDGRVFFVQRVLNVFKVPSLLFSECCFRYDCVILDKIVSIYNGGGQWFLNIDEKEENEKNGKTKVNISVVASMTGTN